MDKKLNNAESTLAADLQASNTTQVVVKTGEGPLFGSDFPLDVTVEQYTGTGATAVVTKRENITISGRSGDVLTIDSRASQVCVQDESQDPKTRTQNALSFLSGDRIYIPSQTEKDSTDLQAALDDIETNKLDKSVYDSEKNVMDVSTASGGTTYQYNDTSITAYSETRTYRVKADVDNTGACTFEINSLGALPVRNLQGTEDLTAGEWKENGIATLVYNSSLNVFQFSGQEAVVAVPVVEGTVKNVQYGEEITADDITNSRIALYMGSDGKVYKTNDFDDTKVTLIGFAKNAGIADSFNDITTGGVASGLSGMTPGAVQYLKGEDQIEDASGISYITSGDSGTNRGLIFTADKDVKFLKAKISSLASGYTRCRLLDSGGSLLQDGTSIGGGEYSFDYDLTNGTTYRIVADDNGGSYVMAYTNSAPGYPIAGTNITYTGTTAFQAVMIDSVTTQEIVTGTISEDKGINVVSVGVAVSATELRMYDGDFNPETVDFVTFTTPGGSATYSTVYNHNLGKVPTKFEVAVVNNSGNTPSHGWFEQGKYGCVGRDGGAREDSMGIIYYSSNDYFKMTVTATSDTQFTITYTEVGSCSTVSGMNVVVKIQ